MDKFINKISRDSHLTEYAALAVTGIMGMLATTNIDLSDLNDKVDNKLMPIVRSIATR